jgi:peptidoglycan/xylan/chitin deacetylase (PgdA/CDA1 family)
MTHYFVFYRSPVTACCLVALSIACVSGCSGSKSTSENQGIGGSGGSTDTRGVTSGSGGDTTGTGGTTTGTGGGAGDSGTGGSNGSAGLSETGGFDASLGSGGSGGASGSGESGGTGGATGDGGSTGVPLRCDNLSLAPVGTGKPKPSGAVGGLTVLDWAGFQGAVSFTFDDAKKIQLTDYPQLKATGAHMTFYVVSSWIGSADIASWKAIIPDGNEIGNHTQSHQSQASLSDLQAAETWIQQNLGVTAYTMAAPNGSSSWNSVAPGVVFLNRGVADGVISPRSYSTTVAFNLPCYVPLTNESSAVMDADVNQAKSGNGWKIVLVHGFDLSDTTTWQPVTIEAVTTTMSHAVNNGMWTENVMNVGAYWVGQSLIPETAATDATWTLPANFPPNMCVRITTTGGTVMQNGQEVPWDDHGYYQISLDLGSVTIQ